MGVRIEKVELPGVGIRHDLMTRLGRRLSILFHRNGQLDLAICDIDDPDASRAVVPLSADESDALAALLGSCAVPSPSCEQRRGLLTEQLPIPADSPFVNRLVAELRARARTGVSIVAILRETRVISSPSPLQLLRAGDTIVAVGTTKQLAAFAYLMANGAG